MRKIFSKKLTSLLLVLVMLCSLVVPAMAENSGSTDESTLKIAVLSDVHYLSPTMIKDTDDYTTALNSDRKLLTEGDAINTAMLAAIKADKPDVLLISGDLTKDGEKEGHEALAQKLEQLQAAVPGLKIYLINGNHDIRNSNAQNYNTDDGVAVDATRTDPQDFKEIYDFVYGDDSIIATFTPAAGNQAGQLSYAASPCEGVTVIAVDTCCYSSDNNSDGADEHETRGAVSAELQAWVTEQAAAAKERGDVVIGLEHHGLVEHFSMESELMSMYLVENYAAVATEWTDAGMQVVFTGHMHANDIAAMTTDNGNTLYDIETGSAVTYTCPIRFVDLTLGGDATVLNVTTRNHLGPITYVDPITGKTETIADLTEYAREHGFTEEMLCTVAQSFLNSLSGKIGNLDISDLISGGSGSISAEKLLELIKNLGLSDKVDASAILDLLQKAGLIDSGALGDIDIDSIIAALNDLKASGTIDSDAILAILEQTGLLDKLGGTVDIDSIIAALGDSGSIDPSVILDLLKQAGVIDSSVIGSLDTDAILALIGQLFPTTSTLSDSGSFDISQLSSLLAGLGGGVDADAIIAALGSLGNSGSLDTDMIVSILEQTGLLDKLGGSVDVDAIVAALGKLGDSGSLDADTILAILEQTGLLDKLGGSVDIDAIVAALGNLGDSGSLDIDTILAILEQTGLLDKLGGSIDIDQIVEFVKGLDLSKLDKDNLLTSLMLMLISSKLDVIVHDICNIPIADGKTLLDVVNYIYQMHLAGEDDGNYPAWVQTGLDMVKSGELVDQIIEIVKKDTLGDLAGSLSLENTITDTMKTALSEYIYKVADSFGNDVNYTEDNNTVIVLGGALTTVPVSTKLGSYDAPALVNGTTVTVFLTATQLDAIDGAGAGTLTVDASAAGAEKVVVSASGVAAAAAAEGVNGLCVKFKDSSLSFDASGLAALNCGKLISMSVAVGEASGLNEKQTRALGLLKVSAVNAEILADGAALAVDATAAVPCSDTSSTLVCWNVSADGKISVLKSSVKGGVLTVKLGSDNTIIAHFPFTDVPADEWCYSDIAYVTNNNYFNGKTATTFEPYSNMTRAQYATVIWRMAGSPSAAGLTVPFGDVSSDYWAYEAIAWGYKNGVVKGYSDKEFGPDDSVTRAQFVTMLYRYKGSPEVTGTLGFKDSADVAEPFVQAVIWASQTGVTEGYNDGTFRPRLATSRAQMAVIMHRYIETGY